MKLQAPRNDKGKGTADIWREQLRPTITTSTEKGTKATDWSPRRSAQLHHSVTAAVCASHGDGLARAGRSVADVSSLREWGWRARLPAW